MISPICFGSFSLGPPMPPHPLPEGERKCLNYDLCKGTLTPDMRKTGGRCVECSKFVNIISARVRRKFDGDPNQARLVADVKKNTQVMEYAARAAQAGDKSRIFHEMRNMALAIYIKHEEFQQAVEEEESTTMWHIPVQEFEKHPYWSTQDPSKFARATTSEGKYVLIPESLHHGDLSRITEGAIKKRSKAVKGSKSSVEITATAYKETNYAGPSRNPFPRDADNSAGSSDQRPGFPVIDNPPAPSAPITIADDESQGALASADDTASIVRIADGAQNAVNVSDEAPRAAAASTSDSLSTSDATAAAAAAPKLQSKFRSSPGALARARRSSLSGFLRGGRRDVHQLRSELAPLIAGAVNAAKEVDLSLAAVEAEEPIPVRPEPENEDDDAYAANALLELPSPWENEPKRAFAESESTKAARALINEATERLQAATTGSTYRFPTERQTLERATAIINRKVQLRSSAPSGSANKSEQPEASWNKKFASSYTQGDFNEKTRDGALDFAWAVNLRCKLARQYLANTDDDTERPPMLTKELHAQYLKSQDALSLEKTLNAGGALHVLLNGFAGRPPAAEDFDPATETLEYDIVGLFDSLLEDHHNATRQDPREKRRAPTHAPGLTAEPKKQAKAGEPETAAVRELFRAFFQHRPAYMGGRPEQLRELPSPMVRVCLLAEGLDYMPAKAEWDVEKFGAEHNVTLVAAMQELQGRVLRAQKSDDCVEAQVTEGEALNINDSYDCLFTRLHSTTEQTTLEYRALLSTIHVAAEKQSRCTKKVNNVVAIPPPQPPPVEQPQSGAGKLARAAVANMHAAEEHLLEIRGEAVKEYADFVGRPVAAVPEGPMKDAIQDARRTAEATLRATMDLPCDRAAKIIHEAGTDEALNSLYANLHGFIFGDVRGAADAAAQLTEVQEGGGQQRGQRVQARDCPGRCREGGGEHEQRGQAETVRRQLQECDRAICSQSTDG